MKASILGINECRTAKLNCDKHGEYEGFSAFITSLDEWVQSECPKCSEEEAARKREAIYEQNRILQKKQEEARLPDAFKNSCIPPRFKDKTMKDFIPTCKEMEDVRKLAERYIVGFDKAMEFGTSFLFTGESGVGKTHLATAIANNIMRKGFTAVYISALNFLSKVKSAWNPNSGTSEDQIIENYVSFDLLILDELGKGTMDAKEKAMIFRLIDRRYEESKPTIGISKLPEKRVAELIDEDAVRRLKSGGGSAVIFNWKPFQDFNF